MQIVIGKKVLFIHLFGRNIIQRGNLDEVLFRRAFHLRTAKGYKSILPFVYMGLPGKQPKCFGKEHTWGDQFTDTPPVRNEETQIQHVENDLVSISFCSGTTIRNYNDGRSEKIDVWYLTDSKMKFNGRSLATEFFPKLGKHGQLTDPLDTATILTELSMGLSRDLKVIKEKE